MKEAKKITIPKYLGKWNEIASTLPSYQKNCRNTTAEYSDKGKYIGVRNSCDRNGKRSSVNLKAFPTKKPNSFHVTFLPFSFRKKGNYNIQFVDNQYKNAIVTAPNTVWFLSRTPKISQDRLTNFVRIAKSKNIDVSNMSITSEPNKNLTLK